VAEEQAVGPVGDKLGGSGFPCDDRRQARGKRLGNGEPEGLRPEGREHQGAAAGHGGAQPLPAEAACVLKFGVLVAELRQDGALAAEDDTVPGGAGCGGQPEDALVGLDASDEQKRHPGPGGQGLGAGDVDRIADHPQACAGWHEAHGLAPTGLAQHEHGGESPRKLGDAVLDGGAGIAPELVGVMACIAAAQQAAQAQGRELAVPSNGVVEEGAVRAAKEVVVQRKHRSEAQPARRDGGSRRQGLRVTMDMDEGVRGVEGRELVAHGACCACVPDAPERGAQAAGLAEQVVAAQAEATQSRLAEQAGVNRTYGCEKDHPQSGRCQAEGAVDSYLVGATPLVCEVVQDDNGRVPAHLVGSCLRRAIPRSRLVSSNRRR